MSSAHTKTMLNTLLEYENSAISLTLNNQNHIPILSVCYLNQCFQITHLGNNRIETYNDVDTTLIAIDHALKSSLQTASN
jgi:hypothetical protein